MGANEGPHCSAMRHCSRPSPRTTHRHFAADRRRRWRGGVVVSRGRHSITDSGPGRGWRRADVAVAVCAVARDGAVAARMAKATVMARSRECGVRPERVRTAATTAAACEGRSGRVRLDQRRKGPGADCSSGGVRWARRARDELAGGQASQARLDRRRARIACEIQTDKS